MTYFQAFRAIVLLFLTSCFSLSGFLPSPVCWHMFYMTSAAVIHLLMPSWCSVHMCAVSQGVLVVYLEVQQGCLCCTVP